MKPCKLWEGRLTPDGYGSYGRARNGSTALAHKQAYEREHGPVPEGLVLDHLCRVRNCVEVSHMEPVTSAVNVKRGAGTGGVLYTPITHCKRRGHPYDEENTRVLVSGYRACRACLRGEQV